MLDTLGRHASFPMRLALANLKVFRPALDVASPAGRAASSTPCMRTTCAATQMSGSS